MRPIKFISNTGEEYDGTYADVRIDYATVPEGLFVYQCRHSSYGDWETPMTIEKRVVVNFAGTFITTAPLLFKDADKPVITIASLLWGDVPLLTTAIFWKDLTKKKQKEILKFAKEDTYLTTNSLGNLDIYLD